MCCMDKQIQGKKYEQRGYNNEESSQFVIHMWLEMQHPQMLLKKEKEHIVSRMKLYHQL